MKAIRVTDKNEEYGYFDFEILDENGHDDGNLYRYYKDDSKFTKVFGIRNNWSKAIRGNARKAVNEYLKIVVENNLPFVIFA